MKKRILKITSILFAIVLIFSACNKSNVKYGNKRIIGTWVHKSIKYTQVINYKGTGTYTTNDCGYENITYIVNYSSTVEMNGNTVHVVSSSTDIEDGEEETINIDTSYTREQVYELTFNEDGSFTEKSQYSGSYNDYNNHSTSYSYNDESTGNWVWVDSYKEKQAVKLIYTSKNWDGENVFSSQLITIKSIDKNEFVLNFIYDETFVGEEYEVYDEDCNGKVIYRTDREEETLTEEGTRTLEKK